MQDREHQDVKKLWTKIIKFHEEFSLAQWEEEVKGKDNVIQEDEHSKNEKCSTSEEEVEEASTSMIEGEDKSLTSKRGGGQVIDTKMRETINI